MQKPELQAACRSIDIQHAVMQELEIRLVIRSESSLHDMSSSYTTVCSYIAICNHVKNHWCVFSWGKKPSY